MYTYVIYVDFFNRQEPAIVITGRQSRTFITFSDHSTFRKAFPIRKRPLAKPKKFCAITKYVQLHSFY